MLKQVKDELWFVAVGEHLYRLRICSFRDAETSLSILGQRSLITLGGFVICWMEMPVVVIACQVKGPVLERGR